MKFCFLLGKSAAETVLMLQEALSKTQVYEWYSRLEGGEMSCEDQPRYMADLQPAKIMKILKKFATQSVQIVVGPLMRFEITGLSWSSCQRMLMENLNMKRVSAKFIPRLLTEDQKNNHLNVYYNDPQILSRVVTGDETWCCGYNPETKQAWSQWKTPNSPKPKKGRQVRSNDKIMLISFFMQIELCTRNLFFLDEL